MGFAAGVNAGVNVAKSIRSNIRQRAQDNRDTKVRECSAASVGDDPAARAECLKGTDAAIPEEGKTLGERAAAGAAEASEYMAKDSEHWESIKDDGVSYVAYDDVAKLKGLSMKGSFGETGVPDDPRLGGIPPMQDVAAAEGGLIDEAISQEAIPQEAMQQGVAGEPVAPAAPPIDRNLAPPAYPDEVISADVPRSVEVDDAVREQAVIQERTNRPYTVKQIMAVDAQLLRNMSYNSPEGANRAIQGVRARRQQQAVGYINSSERAYEAGDMEEAKRNARLAFGFLPSGSSLEFKDIQGKTAGATIDEHSGKAKSQPFVLGSDFYKSSKAIMKDPAQWNLWTAKGEREERVHQEAMRLAKAKVLTELGTFATKVYPSTTGKAGSVGNSGGWKNPGAMHEQSLTAQDYILDLGEDKRFQTHKSVTSDYKHFYGSPQNQQAAQYLTHTLVEANPSADGAFTADAAANLTWYGSMGAQKGGDAAIAESGMSVDVVPNGNTPYGYSVVISRTMKDEAGNEVKLRPATLNASPELIAAYELPAGGTTSGAAAANSRLTLIEWGLLHVDGKREAIFGVPTQAQVDALVSGRAEVEVKDGIDDPDSIGAKVKDIVQSSTREAAQQAKVEQSVKDDRITTDKANAARTPEEVETDSIMIPAEGGMPALSFDLATGSAVTATAAQIEQGTQTAAIPPPTPGASPRMRRAGRGDSTRLTSEHGIEPVGKGTRQSNRYRTPQAPAPAVPPETNLLPPDGEKERFDMVRGPGPGQPAGIPGPDDAVSIAPYKAPAMPMDPGAQELVNAVSSANQQGIDPGFIAAVNGKPAPTKQKASPEVLKTNLHNYAAQAEANLGAAGTPERATIVEGLVQRLANAETGTHKDPWVRTSSPPPEGSTAYGPLQITGTLLEDMQRSKYKDMFTGAEKHMLTLLIAQADKFSMYGTNEAYIKLHPDKPLPKSLPGYDPRYDYSLASEAGADVPTRGGGEAWTPAQKELYWSIGEKTLDRYIEDLGVVAAIDAWRYGANSKKTALTDDPAYVERLLLEYDNG